MRRAKDQEKIMRRADVGEKKWKIILKRRYAKE